jgi:hypothetical protein
MSRKRPTAEEIVAKLRQVEVLTAQGRTVAEALRSIGVTEVSSATSCSTARSSLRSRRPRSSSRAGVAPTTPFAPTHPSAPSRPHPRFSSGRLRFPGQLRRPPRPWRSNLSCTNIRPGPPHGAGQPELCECHVSTDRAACDGLDHPRREEGERQLDAQVALGKTLPLCDGGQVSLAPAGQSLGAGTGPSDRPQHDLASMSRDGPPAWRACDLPN